MATALIAERFVLLVLEPDSGRVSLSRPDTDADTLCAAGLLFDLIVQQRLSLQAPGRLRVDASLPVSNALLNAAAQSLADLPGASADEALRQVRSRLGGLTRRVLESLYDRDFLHRQRDWRFWRRDSLRYPLRSLQARNDAVAALQQACGAPQDLAGLGLLLLADVGGVLALHLHAGQHEQANRILLGLNQPDEADEGRATLALLRQALLA